MTRLIHLCNVRYFVGSVLSQQNGQNLFEIWPSLSGYQPEIRSVTVSWSIKIVFMDAMQEIDIVYVSTSTSST